MTGKELLEFIEQQSLDRSSQEAICRGCDSTRTKYWWATKETKAGKWALCIPDNETAHLAQAEKSKLKDSVVWPPDEPPS